VGQALGGLLLRKMEGGQLCLAIMPAAGFQPALAA